MMARRISKQYHFSVAGETEKWYLNWLQGCINKQPNICSSVSFQCTVEKNPLKFAKAISVISPIHITHICDYESNEPVHQAEWKTLLDLLAKVRRLGKSIHYKLAYSNFSFELWMILHKEDCTGSFSHRTQYLRSLCRVFNEKFENLDQYKHKDNFHRVLSKLSIDDVKRAIHRAEIIMNRNIDSGHRELEYKRFHYYMENPSLTLHETIKLVLSDCGLD